MTIVEDHLGATDIETQAEKVALACRVLGKRDVTYAALGHVSWRIPGTDSMLIKAKGPDEVGLRYTTRRDIIKVDFNADLIEGPPGLQPPSESFIHIWLYRLNPELKSVIHVHPTYAMILTACDKKILPFFAAGPMSGIALSDLRTFPRGIIIADDQLGSEFAEFVGDSSMVLMHGHGVTVTGTSIEQAAVRALDLDWTLELTYKAYALGNPRPILDIDIEQLRRTAGQSGRRRGSAGGSVSTLATWKYYCNLAGEDHGIHGSLAP